MANNVIEVSKVSKRYGMVVAVDEIDLAVAEGEVFGLIGHNGAGKSTLFKMMLGLIPVTLGDIHIGGCPVRGEKFRQVRRAVGYLPENVVFYDNLSGLETLAFFARLKSVDAVECGSLLEQVGLSGAADRRVKTYSKGMRQRLGFAQALLGKPKLLFLDEPTSGLDPEGIREFYDILHQLKQSGATIILTSHILSEIQQRVDRIAIMKMGKIQVTGSLQSLRDSISLPLRFELDLTEGSDAELRQVLSALPGVQWNIDQRRATLMCERHTKMATLQALATLGRRVTDIQILEPTLEDIFSGYAR